MEGPLKGKVALITGSGSGMGVGIALAVAKAGAAVVLVGRTVETLERTRAQIEAAGGRAMVAPCDVTDRAQSTPPWRAPRRNSAPSGCW